MTTDHQLAHAWPSDLSSFCFEVPYSADSVLFERSDGVFLYDTAGRRYLDGLSGVFVTCFGYSCRPIIDAVTEQVATLAFNPPLHGTNPLALRLAEELTALAPAGISAAKLVNGGSEAVEAAIRLARLYHRESGNSGRYKVLSYYHGYHGATFGSLSLTGRPDVGRFGPGVAGAVHVWPPDCVGSFLDVPSDEAGANAARLVERTIEAEGADSVAAIVVEPVIHLRGMAIAPPGYLAALREICDRHGVLLVFDEIVTGFGRTGHPFAAQTFEVTPDLLCAGKGISGGYAPLAALLVSDRIATVLAGDAGSISFAPSHTYAANPTAAAAGLASVRLLRDGGFLPRVRALSDTYRRVLAEALGEHAEIRALGLLYGASLAPAPSGEPAGEAVARACLRRGLIIRGQDDWIVLAPAFVTEEDDMAQTGLVLGEAVTEVYGGRP